MKRPRPGTLEEQAHFRARLAAATLLLACGTPAPAVRADAAAPEVVGADMSVVGSAPPKLPDAPAPGQRMVPRYPLVGRLK